jgi:hypothetical protein
MKNSTITFTKNYKLLLFILNTLVVFLGSIIYLNVIKDTLILTLFPWISTILVVIDVWISFCFLSSDIIDLLNITYKRLLQDILLVLVIFYNTIHVLLSLFFSIKLQVPWYFFYGIYHLIFALALYYIFRCYKTKELKNSLTVLRHTSYFIFSAAIVFLVIMRFVLREEERIRISSQGLIYSFSFLTICNLIFSIYYLFKLKHNTAPNFIAHKYINTAAGIFSIFFVQTIYLNEFCEHIPIEKMQLISLSLGIPCFIVLLILSIRLYKKSNITIEY